MGEYVTLVNEQDEVIGSKDRDDLTDGDRWRIITIWVTNNKGEALIAQRHPSKRINGGKWGPAVAGTVEHGDSYEATASRELSEELGVRAKLTPGEVIFYDSALGKRACKLFRAQIDEPLEHFTFPADEVAAIAWISEGVLWRDVELDPDKYIKEFVIFKEALQHA